MGTSFEERQDADKGTNMSIMSSGLAKLGSLVPALAGPPPADGAQPALEPRAAELLNGEALAALDLARYAVSQHWLSSMESESSLMQEALSRLASALTPSWKEHLEPGASWQCLLDSCSDTLGIIDGEAVMIIWNKARKARSGIS